MGGNIPQQSSTLTRTHELTRLHLAKWNLRVGTGGSSHYPSTVGPQDVLLLGRATFPHLHPSLLPFLSGLTGCPLLDSVVAMANTRPLEPPLLHRLIIIQLTTCSLHEMDALTRRGIS
ncbi:hypothetical protein Bbelb_367610 [Branchiostoma belcheri]|nr:hypothetical protein Bbelb_367610 [Branchiostoma belcheri]